MAQDTKYEGISFNTEWISSFTTVSDFISNASHLFDGDSAEVKLTELYSIATGKPSKQSPKKKVDTEAGE